MKLSEAVSIRLTEIMNEHHINQYQLSKLSGVAESSICDIRLQRNQSVQLRIIHALMDALELGLNDFFDSPLFSRSNLPG